MHLFQAHQPPPQALARDQAKIVLRALLAAMALDGRIDQDEMDILEEQLPRLGLVGSAAEVHDFVKSILDEEHPGVFIDV